jgi:hypothetical protein
VEGAVEVLLEWSGGAKGGFGESRSGEHFTKRAGLLILPLHVSSKSPHAVGKPAPAKRQPSEAGRRLGGNSVKATPRGGCSDAVLHTADLLTGSRLAG